MLDNKIKRLYKSKGLTQDELAELVGITKANLNRIINKKSKPSLRTALKLAEVLETDINNLFD